MKYATSIPQNIREPLKFCYKYLVEKTQQFTSTGVKNNTYSMIYLSDSIMWIIFNL